MPPRKRPYDPGKIVIIGGSSTGMKTPAPDLTKWLTRNRTVSDFIIWERPSTALALSTVAAWRDWNSAEKKLLNDTFLQAWAGKLSTDSTPYPNLVKPLGDDYPQTLIDKDIALQHYMETVACCLMTELSSLGITWSLSKLSAEQKKHLLDSRSLFNWDETQSSQEPGTPMHSPGYAIQPKVMPARPGFMLKMLADEGIIAPRSQKQTIVNMVQWCGKLYHFAGQPSTSNFENYWHYRGFVPLSRVVNGTMRNQPIGESKLHWTAGCYGTTGVISHLLRIINIPVETTYVCDHTLPHFSSIDCWLSHGDDPYMLKFNPNISAEKLLVDKATFDAWFGANVIDACDNVGRRAKELAGS